MKNLKTGRNLVLVFIILALVTACQTGNKAVYSGLGKATDPIPYMEKLRTGTLVSGLRYYILENSKPEERAFLTLAVDAGAVLETEDERGLAHFVEHMAFQGTERFPGLEVVDYLRSLGMRFGPEVNAYTSWDKTVYGIETTVEIRDGVKHIPERALNIIDDWSRAVTFAPDAIDDERRVVLEEYRSGLGAGERLSHELLPILFKGSPYAERYNVIGLPEIIENAPRETIKGFFDKWYRADNMAIIFVGDFDGAALEASLEEHFLIAAPGTPLDRPRYDLPPPQKGSFDALILTDPELTGSSVSLYYKQKPQAPRQDLAAFRENIIERLAATMLSRRFSEAAFKPSTPYLSAGAGYAYYGYSSRFYTLYAAAKPQSVEAALRELFTIKESLARYGFIKDEYELACRSLLSSWEQKAAEKDHGYSDDYVDLFTAHFLGGRAYLSDDDWDLEALKSLLPGISLKEINQTVKKRFDEDDLLVLISAPESEKDSLPRLEQVRAMVREYRGARIDRPQSSAVTGKLIDTVPEPGEIVSESIDDGTGALRWKLGNGLEVILKETAHQNNSISFYAMARGGWTSFPPEMDVSTGVADSMISASGLGSYSRSDLAKILAGKQVNISFGVSGFSRSFGGYATPADMVTLFELIHLYFTQPRFDDEAIGVWLNNIKDSLIHDEENPSSFFGNEISRTISGNSRFHPLVSEDYDKADIEEARQFIHACMNPADYTFVFAGNIDINAMRNLAETYLASIPAGTENFNEWIDVDYQRPRSIVQKEVRKGMEDKSSVYLAWFINETYTVEADASADVLDGYLEIVLNDEIREKMGGVYSISSGVSLSMVPHGELRGSVNFACDPGRADELAAAVESRLRAIAAGTIDRDVFSKAVEALIKSHEENIQSNGVLCRSYANSVVIHRSPLNSLDRWPALWQAVTTANIQRTTARLLSGGGVKMFLYPEEAAR